jgi:hypothetical protein
MGILLFRLANPIRPERNAVSINETEMFSATPLTFC